VPELEIVLAAPFRHTRKERLQKNDVIFYLALDRKWMSREQANTLLERALEKGLLTITDGWITPQFDINVVSIPLGYHPSGDLFIEPEPTQELLTRIAAQTKRPLQEITAEMNHMIAENFGGKLRVEAASILLAKKYHVSFTNLLNPLKEQVMKKK